MSRFSEVESVHAGGRKLLKFLILFENPSLLFFPGQFLSGRVLIELEDETPVLEYGIWEMSNIPVAYKHGGCSILVTRGLFFHVVGEGVVRLLKNGRQVVSDRENYIDFRMRLLGEPGQGPMLLSPGIHSFPFKLGLPLGLPSTFLGKHGWVQYYCKAAFREPSGLLHKNQQVFIVMNPIDLNLEPPILAQPFHCEIEHRLGMNCCTSGTVSCRVRLDRGGYVPGETIGIWASVHNQSRVTIKRTKASLTETIQYMAKNKVVQTETRELASLSRGKIRPRETDDWKNEQLYVPPLPPTNLRGCHIIRIQYDVFIEPQSMEKPIKLQLPIMLATYPLRTEEGTLQRKRGAHYPSTLPVFRPWLDEKTFD